MQRDVESQGALIEQLSALSSILGGTVVASIEEIDLRSLLGRWQLEGPSGTSAAFQAFADPQLLSQALSILSPTADGTPPTDRETIRVADLGAGAISFQGCPPPGLAG